MGRTRITSANLCWICSFQLTRPVWGEPNEMTKPPNETIISTHSPRVGRTMSSAITQNAGQAISTHSPRVGRTRGWIAARFLSTHFNSLAPCGANHLIAARKSQSQIISTHSPRVGRTMPADILRIFREDFNSLAPCGANPAVSSYALPASPFQLTRPVWGEPPRKMFRVSMRRRFQLTRPVWGEPVAVFNPNLLFRISTHSPRVGRTGR